MAVRTKVHDDEFIRRLFDLLHVLHRDLAGLHVLGRGDPRLFTALRAVTAFALTIAALAGAGDAEVLAFAAPGRLADFLHLADHAAKWFAFAAAPAVVATSVASQAHQRPES